MGLAYGRAMTFYLLLTNVTAHTCKHVYRVDILNEKKPMVPLFTCNCVQWSLCEFDITPKPMDKEQFLITEQFPVAYKEFHTRIT